MPSMGRDVKPVVNYPNLTNSIQLLVDKYRVTAWSLDAGRSFFKNMLYTAWFQFVPVKCRTFSQVPQKYCKTPTIQPPVTIAVKGDQQSHYIKTIVRLYAQTNSFRSSSQH